MVDAIDLRLYFAMCDANRVVERNWHKGIPENPQERRIYFDALTQINWCLDRDIDGVKFGDKYSCLVNSENEAKFLIDYAESNISGSTGGPIIQC